MKSPVEICSDERELKNGGDWSGCTSETGEILLLISLCLHFKPIAAIPTGFNGKIREGKETQQLECLLSGLTKLAQVKEMEGKTIRRDAFLKLEMFVFNRLRNHKRAAANLVH